MHEAKRKRLESKGWNGLVCFEPLESLCRLRRGMLCFLNDSKILCRRTQVLTGNIYPLDEIELPLNLQHSRCRTFLFLSE